MPDGFGTDKVQSAFDETQQAEEKLNEGVNDLNSLFKDHGEIKQKDSNKNLGIAAGVGIPGLIGLGYANEELKNK